MLDISLVTLLPLQGCKGSETLSQWPRVVLVQCVIRSAALNPHGIIPTQALHLKQSVHLLSPKEHGEATRKSAFAALQRFHFNPPRSGLLDKQNKETLQMKFLHTHLHSHLHLFKVYCFKAKIHFCTSVLLEPWFDVIFQGELKTTAGV